MQARHKKNEYSSATIYKPAALLFAGSPDICDLTTADFEVVVDVCGEGDWAIGADNASVFILATAVARNLSSMAATAKTQERVGMNET